MDNEKKALEQVPVVNESIGTVFNDNGLVTITYPRYKKQWQIKFLLPKKRENVVKLDFDENGSAVWKLIDGKRNVGQILDELQELAQGQEQFAARVMVFLQSLVQNDLIKIIEN